MILIYKHYYQNHMYKLNHKSLAYLYNLNNLKLNHISNIYCQHSSNKYFHSHLFNRNLNYLNIQCNQVMMLDHHTLLNMSMNMKKNYSHFVMHHCMKLFNIYHYSIHNSYYTFKNYYNHCKLNHCTNNYNFHKFLLLCSIYNDIQNLFHHNILNHSFMNKLNHHKCLPLNPKSNKETLCKILHHISYKHTCLSNS